MKGMELPNLRYLDYAELPAENNQVSATAAYVQARFAVCGAPFPVIAPARSPAVACKKA